MSLPPCCVANLVRPNPHTANMDQQSVATSKSGARLVRDVTNFYEAAANHQIRPNAPPLFKTYQQMMEWKQRQNRV